MRSYVRLNPFSISKSVLVASILLGLSPLGPLPLPWLPGIPASSAISVDPNMIRITADQQNYNVDSKRYSLSGKVTVAYQNILITGSKAEMEVDANGKPSVANFFNRPLFKRVNLAGAANAKAEDQVVGDVIRLYLAEDSFGAEGNVVSNIATVAADPFLIRSDVQQFDNRNKVVTARGNVAVDYQGSQAFSNVADVRMKDDGKAERVVFTGGARIKKESSEIASDKITVMVDSGNLIAESGVKTRVDLKAKADGPAKVYISSDYQQYDKSSDTMIASGRVKIVYGDYLAVGPKATFKLKEGDLDRIFLTGRPTITEKDRTITADKITITTNPRNFDAVGNVKVSFKAKETPAPVAASPSPAAATAKKGGKSAVSAPVKIVPAKQLPKDDELDY